MRYGKCFSSWHFVYDQVVIVARVVEHLLKVFLKHHLVQSLDHTVVSDAIINAHVRDLVLLQKIRQLYMIALFEHAAIHAFTRADVVPGSPGKQRLAHVNSPPCKQYRMCQQGLGQEDVVWF